MEEKYFDLRGLSTYSSIALPTLRDYIKKHNLPCYKVSGKILVQKSEFDQWLHRYRIRRNEDLNALVNEVLRNIRSARYCLGKDRESRCGPEN